MIREQEGEFNPSVPAIRLSPPLRDLLTDLGPLEDLLGTWHGSGFNLIARPRLLSVEPFLQLNLTQETLHFDLIDAAIPNRGFENDDINLFGLQYHQHISDVVTGGLLHVETGMWVNVPPTSEPPNGPTVARLASIPHGTGIVAQGIAVGPDAGSPIIGQANTVPFQTGAPPPAGFPNPFPEYRLSTPSAFRTSPLDPGITQAMVDDPNSVLVDALAGETVEQVLTLRVSTNSDPTLVPNPGGGVQNISFLVRNADAVQVDATFWIERIRRRHGGTFLQLQYTQTVLLSFASLLWPHVSVATLRK